MRRVTDWQPGSPSRWHVPLMVHTQPTAGLSDPAPTPRAGRMTTCFCLCRGLLGVGRRRGVGLGGVDNVRVGAEERGCVRTASLGRIFLCLASSSFHIDFCIYLRKKKGKMLSKSLFKLKQQIWCFLKKHLKKKKEKNECQVLANKAGFCDSWYKMQFPFDTFGHPNLTCSKFPKKKKKIWLFGWEHLCVLSKIHQWGEYRTEQQQTQKENFKAFFSFLFFLLRQIGVDIVSLTMSQAGFISGPLLLSHLQLATYGLRPFPKASRFPSAKRRTVCKWKRERLTLLFSGAWGHSLLTEEAPHTPPPSDRARNARKTEGLGPSARSSRLQRMKAKQKSDGFALLCSITSVRLISFLARFSPFLRRRWLCPPHTISLLEITETPGHSDSYPRREVESGSLIVWG